jgi:hypothetical protein
MLEIISIYYRYGAKELAKTYISSTIMPISFQKASKNFSNRTCVSCSLLILGYVTYIPNTCFTYIIPDLITNVYCTVSGVQILTDSRFHHP